MGDGTGNSAKDVIWLSSCGDFDLMSSCLSLVFSGSESLALTSTSDLSDPGSFS